MEQHSPSHALWCRGFFPPLSYLQDCSSGSQQHPGVLSQLGRCAGCRHNHHVVQNAFPAACMHNALVLFEVFLSGKLNAYSYKLSDKMWHTQHHRSQAQLGKREAVLLLFGSGRKRTGSWELKRDPAWRWTVHSTGKKEADGLGFCSNFLSCAVIFWPFPAKLRCHLKDSQLGYIARQMHAMTRRTVLAYEHHPSSA